MKVVVKDTKPDRKWSGDDFYYTEVIINLNFERFKPMQILEFGTTLLGPALDVKYEGISTTANFVGLSRIDGYPMFEINTVTMDRELKIEQILL
jgi:hypothetical protein